MTRLAYRWLLFAFPATSRDRIGRDLIETLIEDTTAQPGLKSIGRFFANATDLVTSGIAERRGGDGSASQLPPEWREAFEIVVEVQTIMSISPEHHAEAIAAVAGTVAPGGRLLVRTAVRGEDEPAAGRPWALAPSELRHFEALGMSERSRAIDGVFAHIEYRRG